MKALRIPAALLGAAWLGWFVYQDSSRHSAPQDKPQDTEIVTVEVARVATRPIEETIELVGSLEAIARVEIRARIAGYITGLPFEVSATVEQGQTVVTLDASKFDEHVSKAQAALKVAEAQLRAQTARTAMTENTLDRIVQLSKTGASTAQQQEEARSALAVAQAEVELERARVEAAQADLEQSRLARDETRIVSPITGHVLRREAEVGDLAKSDEPLLVIADLKRVRTIVHVVEKDYAKLAIGQPAEIRVDSYPERTFHGKVVRRAPIVDADTRTSEVHLEIDNPETLLLPGMHARVRIVFERRREADVVPVASLIEHEDRVEVFVVEGNPPESRLTEVRTGITDGESVEILSGVKANQRVITLGNRMVKHGQSVRPIEVPWPRKNGASIPAAAEE